jgi:hypothetical protein
MRQPLQVLVLTLVRLMLVAQGLVKVMAVEAQGLAVALQVVATWQRVAWLHLNRSKDQTHLVLTMATLP